MKSEAHGFVRNIPLWMVIVVCFWGGFSPPGNEAQMRTPTRTRGKLYATSWFGGVISVTDVATNQVVTTIFSPDGAEA
jgi:hypothetical protein